MRLLQARRLRSGVFAGRDGFVTPRDLLRWAARHPEGKLALAQEGLMLLCERLRREDEKDEVQKVLESVVGVKLDLHSLYYSSPSMSLPAGLLESTGMAYTKSLARLVKLVGQCLEHSEPALLVGETGAGKTAVCELLSKALGRPLVVVNCHAHTETADLLGSLRPLRGRQLLREDLVRLLSDFRALVPSGLEGQEAAAAPAEGEEGAWAIAIVAKVKELREEQERKGAGDGASEVLQDEEDGTCSPGTRKRKRAASEAAMQVTEETVQRLETLAEEIGAVARRLAGLFEWVDGPLVQAMKDGAILLLDEVSVA